jgi:para-nitrobenzyl esterase
VSLDGTAWQLVRIESMDGTVFSPDERGKYTLTFEPGGRLLVRVDCNRGRGSWSDGHIFLATMADGERGQPPGA